MQSRLCNVLKAVRRQGLKCAAGGKCSRPKKSGAAAGCSVASCKRSYHASGAASTRAGPSGRTRPSSVRSIEGRIMIRRTCRGLVDLRLCLRPEGPELRRWHGHVGVLPVRVVAARRVRGRLRGRGGATTTRASAPPPHPDSPIGDPYLPWRASACAYGFSSLGIAPASPFA